MNDRPLSPSPSHLVVSDSEFAKRSAPGGRLPAGALAPKDHRGGNDWQGTGSGSPNAIAAERERQMRRERPDLVAKRAAKGK
jgi:hypothetical protein